MRILYVNNDGAGFADYIEIESGLTVNQFFTQYNKGHAKDFLIRVNRQPVAADYVLQDGDRVSITPTKIEGAEAKIHSLSRIGERKDESR
jgi:sulfur carrier protein ThiS